MKYRVVFRERSNQMGDKADDPHSYLDAELADGVVLDSVFAGRLEPSSVHSSDVMEEDDAFLSLSGEIWEYDVAEGRDQDFKDAMANSRMVMEFEPLESTDQLGVT